MNDDVLARACEPFFSTRGGAGLGLSMVQGFVAQSGGDLLVDSQPGRGTRVRLRLPRLAPSSRRPNRVGETTLPTLLVVEDDDHVRHIAVRIGNDVGFRVVAVGSAEQALQLLAGEPVDAVFSDILLGTGMTGVALAERLATSHPQLPVALTSGHAAGQFERSAVARRRPFLAKPYSLEDLRRTLSSLLPGARRPTP